MEKKGDSPRSQKELYDCLRNAFTAGGRNNGEKRQKHMSPVMDDIVGRKVQWGAKHTASFFELLIRHYTQDAEMTELMLASGGLMHGYDGNMLASKRRREFMNGRKTRFSFLDERTVARYERECLDQLAKKIINDNDNDKTVLMGMLFEGVGSNGILELQLSDLATEYESLAWSGDYRKYKRDGVISNIEGASYNFTGRESILAAIEQGYHDGHNIQVLGAAMGRGKTLLALEYARRHVGDYQIICWLNAFDDISLMESIAHFFSIIDLQYDKDADVTIDYLTLEFCRFLESNKNYLVIMDAVELTYAVRETSIKKCLPRRLNGDVLITSQIALLEKEGYKLHLVDTFFDSGDPQDAEVFMMDTLGAVACDNYTAKLVQLSGGEPLYLTVMASFIKENKWASPKVLYEMLSDYLKNTVVQRGEESCGAITINLLLDQLMIMCRFGKQDFFTAAKQLILISVIMNCHTPLDLNFLAMEFQVLPEPLHSICMDKGRRRELIDYMRRFSMYELREGTIAYSSYMGLIVESYFSLNERTEFCAELLSKMDIMMNVLLANPWISHNAPLFVRAALYADRAARYMCIPGSMSPDEIAKKYPHLIKYTSICHLL